MKHFFTAVFILTHYVLFSQITDDFSDGDFTANPTWSGTDADYIVNGSFELQLNNSVADTSYLSTPHALANLDNKEWSFHVRQSFSPSGSNYGRVYLTASSADLTTDPDGFYLQFGEAGSLDAVRLFRVESGVDVEILAGTAGQIATSFQMGVRVVRDNTGLWELYLDDTGGTSYALAASATDATNLLGTHFGFFSEYTLSNADNFFYDDVYIGDEVIDVTPPSIASVTAISATEIDVLFNEAVEQTTAETTSNYSYAPNGSAITSAVRDGVNPALVHLTIAGTLLNGSTYTLTVNNVQDLEGNAMSNQDENFAYLIAETPVWGDVIINEFVCDPTPVVGMPDAEFVEIYNRSSKIFNVQSWLLGDETDDGTIQDAWLLPGEYLILTATSDVDSFALETVGVTSWASLNNAGDHIVLTSDLGVAIDSIVYTDEWYKDDNKDGGGYSIERINPEDPCTDISDWAASNDVSGGTPGAQNSIYDTTPDTQAPSIAQTIALAPNFLEVHFSESMDSTSLSDAIITINPTLTIQNNYVLEAYPSMLTLQFQENLVQSQMYEIELQNVADCWSNMANVNATFALPATVEPGDIIINEILFNPVTGGYDYVELYNNSDKLLDLNLLEMANLDDDTISNNALIDQNFLLFPGTYVVITEDTTQVQQQYPASVIGRFVESDLPTYSNDEGTVYLINGNQIIDAVSYLDDWHFQLMDDDDGKSLERIEPDAPSNDRNNWHTAAESIGFGTPGGENSQFYPALTNGTFNYTSETISPDNDGFEDVLQINYEMNAPGYVGTFTVYDDRGRKVATVIDNELLSTTGTLSWQGVSDEGTKASIGPYVGIFEAYDVQGGLIFTGKKVFVVAGNI
ncbi:MAG: lamin tail domain-containing protein [bacterium]|nr:lamin tail domain-containing protein [bacterium]